MSDITVKLRFVHSFFYYGKMRHLFRRKGFPKKTLKGKPGSPEFMDHYHALLEQSGGAPIGTLGRTAGSIDALAIAWYQHSDFKEGLAKATQAAWRPIFDHFRQHTTPNGRRYGQNSVRTLPRKAVVDFLDSGRTINAKRSALKAIRAFIRFAISRCELEKDPTADIKISQKAGPKSAGHLTWLEPQVEQYRARHPLGTMARLAIELLLNIAARREDAHSLGQQHIKVDDGGVRRLTWRPHKTIRSTGRLLSIPIMSELQDALDAIPDTMRADGVLTFIVNDHGKPFASGAAFGNRFAGWCDQAGLTSVLCDDERTRNYRAHGLRKTAMRAAAHAGCTGVELMALGGHSSLKQVQEYIDEVDQERAADAVTTKLETARETKRKRQVAQIENGGSKEPVAN